LARRSPNKVFPMSWPSKIGESELAKGMSRHVLERFGKAP
jgi:hypothetical protein